ncbi:Asp/Glu racemase [Meridianimarinicoccus roseus]|uniref:Asp/Glu racemase n=1 Tax=Meridianimarinicoccus roseus TaxID=2072018 RepID=A0A2V2LKQ6_9RHOB|nr:aspartate/glutamate racemase family protein [Meridianimarinicoccus roseus]PWR04134.1 Asp/Glu racemase [Meridianimarinicoccus roseus]
MVLPSVHVITPIISVDFRNDSGLEVACESICRLTVAGLDKGPASVESAVDEVLAAPGVVDAAIAAEARGIDALVIDCMLDPGLEAAREAVGLPVIGAGEAGLHEAARFGRFAVVTVLDRQAPAFAALARKHGLSDLLAGVHGIAMPVLALEQDRDEAIFRTVAACRRAMAEQGAQSIVFGCTGMLGFAEPVAAALDLPVERIVDPLPHAVREAAGAAGQAVPAHPRPDPKRVTGFDDWSALSALMAREADA